MNPPPAPLACPSCGRSVTPGRSACPNCGALVELETALQRLSGAVRVRVRAALERVPRPHLNRWTLLWLLAAMPLLVGPPAIAALYGGVTLGIPRFRTQFDRSARIRLVVILVLGIANAALSIYAWSLLANGPISDLLDQLRRWLDWQQPFSPGAKVVPI